MSSAKGSTSASMASEPTIIEHGQGRRSEAPPAAAELGTPAKGGLLRERDSARFQGGFPMTKTRTRTKLLLSLSLFGLAAATAMPAAAAEIGNGFTING